MDLKNKLDEMTELTSRFDKMNVEEFMRSIKTKNVTRFMAEKYNNPSLSKKEICKRIGISLPVLNQNLRDLSYNEFIRKRNVKKSNKKTAKKKIEKNDLKGGTKVDTEVSDEVQERLKNIL